MNFNRLFLKLNLFICDERPVLLYSSVGINVRGELVFNVMEAGWFCEKSSLIGKVEDVKPVLVKKNIDFNRQPFWGGRFLPGWIVK